MEHIGERLKWFRNQLKERQDVFAGRMNVSKTTLISYEKGETDPGANKLKNLYNTVNNTDQKINLGWFITGDGDSIYKNTDYEKIRIENLKLKKMLEVCDEEKNKYKERIDELQQDLIEYFKNNMKD